MILHHRLHGSFASPALRQALRIRDGVRGIFASSSLPRGSLLMSVPFCYCSFPYGLAPTSSPSPLVSPMHHKEEWRMNHFRSFFPEFSLWRRRLSGRKTDNIQGSTLDNTHLFASRTEKENSFLPALQAFSSSENGDFSTTLCLSSSEAALAVCVALRYFSDHVTRFPPVSLIARNEKEGPYFSPLYGVTPPFTPSSSFAGEYVKSLPIKLFLERGVEALFSSSSDSLSSSHICLEQLSWNLRDEILQYANHAEYRILDAHPSSLDDILLVALYVVRSRILPVTLLRPGLPDRVIHALMPGVDGLNHTDDPNAAVVASSRLQAVVVRTIRDIVKGEEVRISYNSPPVERKSVSSSHRFVIRYLMQNGSEEHE